MNNITQRNIVLAALALGLITMLAVAMVQRVSNPHLVVQGRGGGGMQQQSMNADEGGMPMSPEVGNLMQAVKENPNDVPTLIHLTEHLIESGELDAAENFIHRALSLEANNAQLHYLHGIILYNADRHDEAVKSFEQVVALQDNASARYSLGILQVYHFKNVEKGIAEFELGLKDPSAPDELKDIIRAEIEKAKNPQPK